MAHAMGYSLPAIGQRCEAFFQIDWRRKSVEQLSQLFTASHASGLERKHLGQMFYNKCFTALAKTANSRVFASLRIHHGVAMRGYR